jgi:stage IV sporulation protein FB
VFFEPSETQFDLRFRLFGIPVRVHPWFWVVSAMMGWGSGPGQNSQEFFQRVLIWIACVFVSILIHELGHVVAGQWFGSRGNIVLYSMGGLAIGSSDLDRRWQRIAVSAAGPAAGFLLLGLIWGAVYLSGVRLQDVSPMAERAYVYMIAINLFWGLVNLLPIWPLDGGKISREVCDAVAGDRGIRVALGISTLVAGAIAAHAVALKLSPTYQERVFDWIEMLGHWSVFLLYLGGWHIAIFFGLLALSSLATLQAIERQQREWDDHWQD